MNQAYDGMMKELPSEVQKAVITYKHELTPSFKYIAEWRKRREADNKKILVLGAGFVAKPCVKYLRRVPTHLITVADVSAERAQKVAGKKSNTQGIAFDVNRQDLLEELIKDHDIVICLLPGQFNIGVAKVCMKYQRHLITANYISPEMRALDAEAKERGVLLLNETGLDPGIDHMTAMEHIDEVKENGGEITSFVSWCGGLPAPECSGNPLGYKFSWSPKGVLIASTRDALYRVLGQEVNVSGMELFKKSQKLNIFPAFALEGVPNRNSLAYADEYNIQSAETVFRGTLRYNGFSEVMEALVDLGLLSEKKLDYLAPEANKLTWSAFLKLFLNEGKTRPENISTRQTIIRKLISPPAFPSKGYDQDKVRRVLEAFEWLGLISDSEEIALLGTPMDALCAQLLKKLTFEPNDRDIVILHHIFGIKWSDGRRETRTSTLVVYGEPGGETAMSKTVGLPVAIAADLILKGEIKGSGVVGPIRKDIYKPMLEGLKNEGIEPVTKSSVFNVNI
jgi:saccharopine dehydrogenase-like NADP-dependent oxidoreductase